jgi:NAD(P) transhydrogenase subunit alpha
MIVGVPKETFPGERRVALIPSVVPLLTKKNVEVVIEAGAGESAGALDKAYEEMGCKVAKSRAEIFSQADVIFQVRGLGANPKEGKADLDLLKKNQILVGMFEPLSAQKEAEALAKKKVTTFALELLPRTTRAQAMDVLSSQANLAGYKAVLLASDVIPGIYPMMMTPAGTIKPASVFVLGAGVAGLQAIATAKRLGAKVLAFDVRPVVKEQVESLGAKFLDLGVSTEQDSSGYAKEQSEEQIAKQRELMIQACADSNVVITTAQIPGRKAPILVTKAMVEAMRPGSCVVDLAASTGGNCELTKMGETVIHKGVSILGPENPASLTPAASSQMYARNLTNFLLNMIDKEGNFAIKTEDEIVRESMLTRDGEIVSARAREVFGLPALAEAQTEGGA